MTEQQPYDVLERYPGFELRRYPEHLVAEVDVTGPFGVAGNLAFPKLARYIGGHNRASRKVAMTAPVVQERDPRSGVFVVGFVMPSDVAVDDVPEPADSSVRTRQVPAQTAAALKACGAQFKHVNIFEDPEVREALKSYSNWPTFPQLYVGGELVGGCDITLDMFRSGELKEVLQEAGAIA